jgi:beta-glucosidase
MDNTRAWRVLSRKARLLTAGAVTALLAVPATAAAAAASPAAVNSAASTTCPWVTSRAPISQRVAQLMSQMTLADEITMVEGHGTSNPYVFYTPAIPALCIPAVGLEDGPAGVADGLTGVTQLPAGVALAATWDPSLAGQYGTVIGAEEYGKGASANLGPTVNIPRGRCRAPTRSSPSTRTTGHRCRPRCRTGRSRRAC